MDEKTSKFLLKKYFENRSFVQHNIDSYNDFIKYGVQRVVNEVGEIVPDILPIGVRDLRIKLGKVSFGKPFIKEADGSRREITPMEARLRDLTYEAPIYVDMTIVKNGEESDIQKVHIGNIPVMLKSNLCVLNGLSKEELVKLGEDPEDFGGYFIINGTERVVVTTEELITNKVLVDSEKTGTYPFTAKVFSEDGQYNIPHTFEKARDGVVYVSFTKIQRIPFVILMKALGLTKDADIVKAVSLDEEFSSDMYINLYNAVEIKNREAALDFIGKSIGIMVPEKRIERAQEMLDNFFFPHLGHSPEDRLKKARFLGQAVKKLLLVSYGKLPPDDKDHYSNKRLKLCGDSLETLFRFTFRMLVGDLKYNFERVVKRGKLPALQSVTRSQLLTSRLRSAMATGEWVGDRHGISQHLDRFNKYATLSHLTRVVSLLTASRENFEARDLHPTHWGKLCASETPEGVNVGLRKNLAITCEISPEPEMSEEEIAEKLFEAGVKQ